VLLPRVARHRDRGPSRTPHASRGVRNADSERIHDTARKLRATSAGRSTLQRPCKRAQGRRRITYDHPRSPTSPWAGVVVNGVPCGLLGNRCAVGVVRTSWIVAALRSDRTADVCGNHRPRASQVPRSMRRARVVRRSLLARAAGVRRDERRNPSWTVSTGSGTRYQQQRAGAVVYQSRTSRTARYLVLRGWVRSFLIVAIRARSSDVRFPRFAASATASPRRRRAAAAGRASRAGR
jgi:hypothetical protein